MDAGKVSPVEDLLKQEVEEEEEEETEELSAHSQGSETQSQDGSTASSPIPFEEEHSCQICNKKYEQPRILSCLHVFCTACLEKQVENGEDTEDKMKDESPIVAEAVQCITCKQETRLGTKGVANLPLDDVFLSTVEGASGEDAQIVCTSCKAKEKAVAQCSDCVSFLCAGCVTAHQYMRCFENHKVVSFEELQGTDGICKPAFCVEHVTEIVKHFCVTCQILVCNDCVAEDHPQPLHQCEKISDVEEKSAEELKELVKESRDKIKYCEEATSKLENCLSELQSQRDNARSLIKETFQSYKAILEQIQDEKLEELEKLQNTQELQIMDLFHSAEVAGEKIDDGASFTERVLEKGTTVDMLRLKKLISTQLLMLINNTPKADVAVDIVFQSDLEKFKNAVQLTFGGFRQPEVQEEVVEEVKFEEPVAISPHSSFENEGFVLPPGVLSAGGPPDVLPSVPEFPGIDGLPPLSIPNIVSLADTLTADTLSAVSPSTINSIAASMQNLHQTERSSSRNSYSPAMSDSGISVDAASTSSATNNGQINYATLSKIGAVSFGGQGQVSLNGQLIPGLNMNNITGAPPSTPSPRVATPTQQQPDPTLANILGGMTIPGVTSGQPPGRVPTPQFSQLNDLMGLLNQPTSAPGNVSSQMNGMGNIASGSNNPTNIFSQPPPPPSPGFPIHGGGMNMSTPPPPNPSYGSGANPPFPQRRSSGKMSAMQIRCKFGQLGPGKGQFNSPHGFCLGLEEDIIVADTNNHRIQVFEKTGEFKYQFGIPGREEGQLWYPRKVAVMRHSGKYVVCDRGSERSRMQIFNKNGHFIKKIAIRYIDIVAGLAITPQGHIVAVDSVSPTVFCIAETGELLKWFDCSDYMREPSDIAISGKEYFVCDFKGHCVVVFNEDGQFMRRIGCENITNFPNGIDISDAGDVLVGDSHGNRFHVAVFQRDGSLIGEFECPYVKVSRCCGLKITAEGYVVTLAKNNHHVLVLNTLYIT